MIYLKDSLNSTSIIHPTQPFFVGVWGIEHKNFVSYFTGNSREMMSTPYPRAQCLVYTATATANATTGLRDRAAKTARKIVTVYPRF